MRIEKIKLYNYRLYKGLNQIVFPKDEKKNIYVIYGENGFGKTTLLQSLMWCLYGRMIIEVDDLSKTEINGKGYENYLKENLNAELGRDAAVKEKSYYIEIQISELRIPTMPPANLSVRRSYDVTKSKESFELLIDGHENELARQIGYDVFVNDFVLNKDIARLFFFDSERIVKLAEGQSREERMRLGSAYNHVIGIKKYEDLRANLEGISLKMKRETLGVAEEVKFLQLTSWLEVVEKELNKIDTEIIENNSQLYTLKQRLDSVQKQLLREGSMIDLDAKQKAVEERELRLRRNQEFKDQLKDYLDYAPFAFAGSLFGDAVQLIEHDFKVAESKNNFSRQKETITDIKSKLEGMVWKADLTDNQKLGLFQRMSDILSDYQVEPVNEAVMLCIDDDIHNQAVGVSSMLYTTFQAEIKMMLGEYKRNKQQIDKLNKLLCRSAEEDANEKMLVLKQQLETLKKTILDLEKQLFELGISKATRIKEKEKIQQEFDSFHVSMQVREKNKEKQELTTNLIREISNFLRELRSVRNKSIEQRIKRILNTLMHKSDFVDSIQLGIENDDFDVKLFSEGLEIQKNALSKGEQQLYATALLMSLVEESGIEFPVFIDSPLQKFDKKHAERIIIDFYPNVSGQVVLLPIFEKELTKEEEMLMEPMVKSKYRIFNDGMHSRIEELCSNR